MRGPKLPDEYAGVLELDAPPPVWVSLVFRHVVVGKTLAQPGQQEVRLVVAVDALQGVLGRARLQVVDSGTRRPVVGANVDFSDRQSSGVGKKVGEDGVVVCEDLPPGILELTIREQTHEAYHTFVRFEPGSDLDLGVIALDPQTKLGGSVVGADGQPASGVRVSYFRVERYAPDVPLNNGFSASSDAAGKFDLWGVGRGRYRIQARAQDGALATAIVDTSHGAVEDLQLRLATSIAVQVDNSLPKSKTCLVTVRDPAGEALWSWNLRPGPSHPLPMLPGSYTVEIRDEQTGAVRAFPFTVAPGAKLRIP